MKLDDYREISARCSQCNFCQAFCPVFRIRGTENWLARNRLNLIRDVLIEKKFEPTARFREILDTCLLCSSCTQNCSSSVPVDEIIISARHEMADTTGTLSSLKKKMISGVMKSGSAMNLLGKAGALAQKMGLAPEKLPSLSSRPFFSRRSGTLKPEGTPNSRVAYYAGCGTNFMFPETGEAVTDILLKNGREVVIPENLSCCGIPLLSEGDTDGAAELLRKNIEILAGIECDRIIMDCTSCMMMFTKKGAKLFPQDDPIKQSINALATKTVSAHSYIHEISRSSEINKTGGTFTYHVPCHLERTKTGCTQTADILARLTGSEYIPLEEPELCCGAGGTYYLKDSNLSENLRNLKISDIERTGASVVVTECPICRFYIGKVLKGIAVMHPVEFLLGNRL